MNEIEKLFNPLIEAFDKFLNKEEKEIGCLKTEEHSRFISDRNFYVDLLVEKLNVRDEQPQKEKECAMQIQSIIFRNDEDGADNCKKRSRFLEIDLL